MAFYEEATMTTIIMRPRRDSKSFSALLRLDWPPDVARIESDGFGHRREVTWDDVMARRRERQQERLEQIQRPDPPRIQPCYVWVFRVPGWLYGGWWCYVVLRTHGEIAVNFQGFRRDLAVSIMRAAPCGFLPLAECFGDWMPAFAKQHPRPPVRDPRQAGSLVGWLRGRSEFTRMVERHPQSRKEKV